MKLTADYVRVAQESYKGPRPGRTPTEDVDPVIPERDFWLDFGTPNDQIPRPEKPLTPSLVKWYEE